ncbi:MAG: aldo/keto reductase [Pseudomonadota bacterium]
MSAFLPLPRTTTLGPFTVGRLAYGCWRFAGTPVVKARAKIHAARAAGMSLLDTAAIYGYGETAFGEAEERLGDLFAADAALRGQIVLVTKAGIHPPAPYDSRKSTLIASAEASLKRLRTDVLDVFLIHRPDFLASHEEVAAALSELVQTGKARTVGVSNYTPAQTRALQAHLDVPLVATQPEFSALCSAPLDDGTLDLAQEFGMCAMAWSPLGGGALATGTGDHPRLANVIVELDRIANAQGTSRDLVALAWVLAHPAHPIALIGSQTPARIAAAAGAYDIKLTRRDWYAVLEASRGAPMP